jgi:hypothetical protein
LLSFVFLMIAGEMESECSFDLHHINKMNGKILIISLNTEKTFYKISHCFMKKVSKLP